MYRSNQYVSHNEGPVNSESSSLQYETPSLQGSQLQSSEFRSTALSQSDFQNTGNGLPSSASLQPSLTNRLNDVTDDRPALNAVASSHQLMTPAGPPTPPGTQHDVIRDEQISGLFTAMGRASKLSTIQLAQRLQTHPDYIQALESGDLDRVPEWEELSGIVARYSQLMGVDDRPILRRLREKLTDHYISSISSEQSSLDDMPGTLPPPSPLPMSDASLKAFATGSPPPAPMMTSSLNDNASGGANFHTPSQIGTPSYQQVTPVHNNLHQQNAFESPHQSHSGHTHLTNGTPQQGLAHAQQQSWPKKKPSRWFMKLVANVAFILILLVGFMHWQPNRFWSGVDTLPKPIAKSIYSLFEFVMPDPLASTYRMNWVYVDDPRLRKADRLPVPEVKQLPALDFSNLSTFSQ